MNMGNIKLHLERLNPMDGIGRLFSMNSIVELLKGMAKMVVIGSIAYNLLAPLYHDTEAMTGIE